MVLHAVALGVGWLCVFLQLCAVQSSANDADMVSMKDATQSNI